MNDHPLANIFPLLEGDQLQELADDIRANGLREPIVLHQGAVLDGRNRYRACKMVGVEPRFETFSGDDPLAYVISLNLKRRHLDESQRAMVAAKIATLQDGQRQVGQLADVPTQEQAASLLNISERTVRRAREVLDEGAPELVEAVERGKVSVSAAADISTLTMTEQAAIAAMSEKEILHAAKEIRARKADEMRSIRIERIATISMGNEELGTSERFPIVLADPPWRYENPPMGATNRSNENHYPTMTLDEICELRVSDLATDDALLYLWATAPKLA